MKTMLLCVVFSWVLAATASAQELVFIAHPQVSESALAASEVTRILLGDRTKWDSGAVIRLAVLTEGAVHERVLKDYVQRTSDQFAKYWKKQVFTGKGVMPTRGRTDAEIVDYVATTAGAFGYVERASAGEKVKILAVPQLKRP